MDFDEARNATMDMFSQENLAGDNGGIEGDVGGEQGDASAITDAEAQQAALQQPAQQQTAQMMQQPDETAALREELARLRQQVEAGQQQNAQLQNLINQQSQVQEEAVEEMVMPQFDFAKAFYADEDEQRRMSLEYSDAMMKYITGRIEGDMKPMIEEYRAAANDRETRKIIGEFSKLPEFAEMEQLMPQMTYIMEQNPRMFNDSVPLTERLVMAYTAARGANAEIGEHKYTLDELMGLYDGNDEFRNAIEQRRVAAVKKGQQVPPAAASSGAANVALNIKDKPKTTSEALEATRRLFGLN